LANYTAIRLTLRVAAVITPYRLVIVRPLVAAVEYQMR